MRKDKGFTLIELLAVIVILAIIALIAVPVIMNIISSARESAFEDTAYGLIDAGEMYYASSLLENGMTSDVEFTITDGKFVGENKLEVKGALPTNGKITVTKDGKVAIAVNNGAICAKKRVDDTKVKLEETIEYCTLESTLKELVRKTTEVTNIDGCATSGTCAPGTKFAIEVAPNNIQNFYVVRDADNKVTLIMDRNIGETVAWITKNDYLNVGGQESEWGDNGNVQKGPITALKYLESQTSSWINIMPKDYILTDSDYGTMTRTNARARLLTFAEALEISSNDWAYGNLSPSSSPRGYWTSSTYETFCDAWYIRYDASVLDDYVINDGSFGVRPVIEIPKTII